MRVSANKAINWNRVEDSKDLEVWNRLTSNFWMPEKIPLSNDVSSWNTLTDEEKLLTIRVFTGLTMLDTIQGRFGAPSLAEDAETLHEEAVYSNIGFMEALSSDHDLLTPHGWKNIAEIKKGELVMQYSPESNSMNFAPVVNATHHFNKEVYRISSRNENVNMVVSGGHRTYYEEKVCKNNACREWKGTTVEARELQNINLKTAHRRFRHTGAVNSTGNHLTNLEKLLIAIQADGTIDNWTRNSEGELSRSGAKTGTIPVRMALTKYRKRSRIEMLMTELGFRFSQADTDTEGECLYTLYIPKEHLVYRDKKFVDWFTLDGKGREWCEEFITEIGLWDGHTHKKYDYVAYYSKLQTNVDFVVAVAAMAGYRVRKTCRVDSRSDSFSDSYIAHVSRDKDTTSAQTVSITPVEPQEVYCVEVPSTYLLTRNGHSTMITGNCIHAKSYSSIFSTLCSTEDIDAAFRWSEENEFLQKKADIVLSRYDNEDPLKKKIASVFLESFLFYSGFYLPLYWNSQAKLTNTADIIRLIIRDEAVHGYYVGYKFQQQVGDRFDEMEEFANDLLMDLYANEILYTESLYDDMGKTEDVKKFLCYNANKAMMNLGFEAPFSSTKCDVSPVILSSLSPDSDETHDFFSGSGSSYVIGTTESTDDDDWDF